MTTQKIVVQVGWLVEKIVDGATKRFIKQRSKLTADEEKAIKTPTETLRTTKATKDGKAIIATPQDFADETAVLKLCGALRDRYPDHKWGVTKESGVEAGPLQPVLFCVTSSADLIERAAVTASVFGDGETRESRKIKAAKVFRWLRGTASPLMQEAFGWLGEGTWEEHALEIYSADEEQIEEWCGANPAK